MVAYQEFVTLCGSESSEDRGRAAHLAALAYLGHTGPADEHAALYSALVGFLDDPSVKVRAALAYGLLHSPAAPRPILLALLQDSAVIARAVAQYSPVLIDVDLIPHVRGADPAMLEAIAERERVSSRLAHAIIAHGERELSLRLLRRHDVAFAPQLLMELADRQGEADSELRGVLLDRPDLPGAARLRLVELAVAALRSARVVKGAVAPARLQKLLRNAADTALTAIGEREAVSGNAPYAVELIESERISARVMLHAMVNGHVLFFADCLAALCRTPRQKVLTLLRSGSRAALHALLARSGLKPAVGNLVARLVCLARAAEIGDDVAARHFVVTALTEELIVEHEGVIPPELEDAFTYLCEQNVLLARRAAQGVMPSFARVAGPDQAMPELPTVETLALPAA